MYRRAQSSFSGVTFTVSRQVRINQVVRCKVIRQTRFNGTFYYCRAAIAVMRCPSVRLSVCLSVTFVSCAKTNKDIFDFFSPSGSHTILVFPYQTGGGAIPTGTPLTGASTARVYEKIDDFRPISRFISEMVIVRMAHAARQIVSIDSLSIRTTFSMIAPGASPGETKMWAAVRENGDFLHLQFE